MSGNENSHENELEALLEQEKATRRAMLSVLEDLQEAKAQIEKAHCEWMDAFDTIKDGVMLHDREYNIMRVNRAYKELSGAEKFKEIIGKPYWKAFPKMDGPMRSCRKSIKEGEISEEEFTLEDGRIIKSRAYPVNAADGNYSYGIHLFEDVTDSRRQELQIISLNKTLRLIGRCNELLVRSTSEKGLLKEICDEIISHDAYDFAGIYFQEGSSVSCTCYSTSGSSVTNPGKCDLADSKYHSCPVAVCIEQNRALCINDMESDPEWSEYLRSHRDICLVVPNEIRGSMLLFPLVNVESFGAMAIYCKEPNMFDDEKIELFRELSEDTAYGIHTLRLRLRFEEVTVQREETLAELKDSLDGTIRTVARMVEVRDPYTAGHQNRVSGLAVAIAVKMGFSDKRIEGLRLAGMVHDIGKIQLPAEILSKPAKITAIEYEMIKCHPQTGYEILKDIKFPWPIAQIIRQHHERLDGSGYPDGLKDEEILLEAKIIAVADVVEAMASHRPYRAALGIEMALHEIEKHKGVFFDPDVVDTCVFIFREDEYSLQ